MRIVLILLLVACTPSLDQINRSVNSVPYVANTTFDTPEHFYRYGGDCDSYVFTKIHELNKHGYFPNTPKIPLPVYHGEQLHMVLQVGDLIFDNMSYKIEDINYLKRYEEI